MKILVISDTHGKLNMVRDVLGKLSGIDLIAHAGDHFNDVKALEREFNIPCVGVCGNCDSSGPSLEVIETPCGKILLVHGHKEHVNYDLSKLRYRALENNCRAIIYGHTHVAHIEEMDDMYFINPGSLPQPRDGSGGSFGIIRATPERLDASIVYYNTVMGLNNKKSGNAGFIKGILNYCDRF